MPRTPEQLEAARVRKNDRAKEARANRRRELAARGTELAPEMRHLVAEVLSPATELPATEPPAPVLAGSYAIADAVGRPTETIEITGNLRDGVVITTTPAPTAAPNLKNIRTIGFRKLPKVGELGIAIHKCHRATEWTFDATVAAIMQAEGVTEAWFQLYDNRSGWLWSHGLVALRDGVATITQIG